MSDEEEMRRHEEEWNRFQRIRSLDTGVQETPTGRRRHAAGGHPSILDSDNLFPGSQSFNIDPLSSAPPFARGVQETPTGRTRHDAGGTQSYGVIQANMNLDQKFRQSLNLGETQTYPTGSGYGQPPAAAASSHPERTVLSRRPYGGAHRIQPAPSSLSRHLAGQQVSSHPERTVLSRRPYGGAHRIQPAPSSLSRHLADQQVSSHPERTVLSRRPYGGAHQIQPAPSSLSRHLAGQQVSGQSLRSRGNPHLVRKQPIPEPQLTNTYRDPVTGGPSSEQFQQPPVRPLSWGGGPASIRELGSYLANLSRDNISEGIRARDSQRSLQRQKEVLLYKGFQRVEDRRIRDARPAERFAPQSTPSVMSQRRRFMPQTERDRIATGDYRFNRPLGEMSKPILPPPESKIAHKKLGALEFIPEMEEESDSEEEEEE